MADRGGRMTARAYLLKQVYAYFVPDGSLRGFANGYMY